jgi:hypothetical protein
VCTLSHVFEGLGFATIALASVREQAERIQAPRTLFCDFPLGRPLGKPNDPPLQRSVLRAAFQTLQHSTGPVWAEYPEIISGVVSEEFVCALPPRFNPLELPAVDEAIALRNAYDRTVAAHQGRTNFGRVLTHQSMIDGLRSLHKIAVDGVAFDQAGLPADPIQVAIDLRAYYIEAAMSLADSTTNAGGQPWAIEQWFYERTEAGRLLLGARRAMKAAGVAQPTWFYMATLDR